MIMKKSLALAAVLGVATLLATPVVGNAAAVTSGGTTTATVGLTQDPDNAAVELTNAPNIKFGQQELGADPLSLNAANIDDDGIVVSNPGLANGWVVNVKASAFEDLNNQKTLKGAELSIAKGTIAATDDGNESTAPTSNAVVIKNKVSDSNINEDQPIFSATQGAGIGTWKNTHALTDVTLDIPAGNVAGDYTSTLTWTLTDAPA